MPRGAIAPSAGKMRWFGTARGRRAPVADKKRRFGSPFQANFADLVPTGRRNPRSQKRQRAFSDIKPPILLKAGYQIGHLATKRYQSPLFCQQMRAVGYQTSRSAQRSAVGYQTSRSASKCVIWGVRARVLSIVHQSFIMIVQYAILPKEYRREVLR